MEDETDALCFFSGASEHLPLKQKTDYWVTRYNEDFGEPDRNLGERIAAVLAASTPQKTDYWVARYNEEFGEPDRNLGERFAAALAASTPSSFAFDQYKAAVLEEVKLVVGHCKEEPYMEYYSGKFIYRRRIFTQLWTKQVIDAEPFIDLWSGVGRHMFEIFKDSTWTFSPVVLMQVFDLSKHIVFGHFHFTQYCVNKAAFIFLPSILIAEIIESYPALMIVLYAHLLDNKERVAPLEYWREHPHVIEAFLNSPVFKAGLVFNDSKEWKRLARQFFVEMYGILRMLGYGGEHFTDPRFYDLYLRFIDQKRFRQFPEEQLLKKNKKIIDDESYRRMEQTSEVRLLQHVMLMPSVAKTALVMQRKANEFQEKWRLEQTSKPRVVRALPGAEVEMYQEPASSSSSSAMQGKRIDAVKKYVSDKLKPSTATTTATPEKAAPPSTICPTCKRDTTRPLTLCPTCKREINVV